MTRSVTVSGKYSHKESRHVSTNWRHICADHEEEFPEIHQCHPGTFNVVLSEPYLPPDETRLRQKSRARGLSVCRYEDGNHVSPYAKVVAINESQVEAWIYRGGHGNRPVLELLSRLKLSEHLHLSNGAPVSLTIEEGRLGRTRMPAFPGDTPGKLAY